MTRFCEPWSHPSFKKLRLNDELVIPLPGLEIYHDQRKVYRGRCEIELTAKEYEILIYLIINREHVLTYDQIYQNTAVSHDLSERSAEIGETKEHTNGDFESVSDNENEESEGKELDEDETEDQDEDEELDDEEVEEQDEKADKSESDELNDQEAENLDDGQDESEVQGMAMSM